MKDLINQQATTLVQEVVGRARIGAWCPQCKEPRPSHYAHEHCPVCRSKLMRHEPGKKEVAPKPSQTEFPK